MLHSSESFRQISCLVTFCSGNAFHRINAKLGGINTVPSTDSRSTMGAVQFLNDPKQPTIVIGVDVMHPGAVSDRPSYAAVTASLDSPGLFAGTMRPQAPRQEIIEHLGAMVEV